MYHAKTILIAAVLMITLSAAAQPGGQKKAYPGPPGEKFQEKELLTVEQEAQIKVDGMAKELPLTDKQVKKLVNYYKNDIRYRRDNFEFDRVLVPILVENVPKALLPAVFLLKAGGRVGFPVVLVWDLEVDVLR